MSSNHSATSSRSPPHSITVVVRVLDEFEEAASIPVGRLRQVVDAMAVEMHAGLASEMLLTFVDNLPDGEFGFVDSQEMKKE
ncbi:unnamed protein product [Lactuca virosa]|uniref:Hexokinase N-terminal domain-containing protein n=1 Tax=Lactuca virosa TaxID=75947 RepID=A0AAU9MRZ3_9ASTR|nr:unnamed protein product [Lactuca virosa]CAH1424756.1 unnamed protein product [Lactuca virosa]